MIFVLNLDAGASPEMDLGQPLTVIWAVTRAWKIKVELSKSVGAISIPFWFQLDNYIACMSIHLHVLFLGDILNVVDF